MVKRNQLNIFALAFLCFTICLHYLAHSSGAEVYIFTKVADYQTAIPQGAGNFSDFRPPSISEGRVGFWGQSGGLSGIYLYDYLTDQLEVVVDENTPAPEGAGNFLLIGDPSISSGNIAFWGTSRGGIPIKSVQGIFTYIGGALDVLVDAEDWWPEKAFGRDPSISSDKVTFIASNYVQTGVYTNYGSHLSIVADGDTLIPEGFGEFTHFWYTAMSNGKMVFRGSQTGQSGIYIYDYHEGLRKVVADLNTEAPGGNGTFAEFQDYAISGDMVTFYADCSSGRGIFLYNDNNGQLEVVADQSTPIPEHAVNFYSFGWSPSISGNKVAFEGQGSGFGGIYLYSNSSIEKVIERGDVLDGRSIVSVPELGDEGLHSGQIAFRAYLNDATYGIFIASPSSPIIYSFKVTPECVTPGTDLFKVRFECSAHDPDGTIGLYQIDFGDNTSQPINRTGIFTHTYSQKDDYNVTCLVVDNTGNTDSSEPTEYGENNNHTGPIPIPIDSDEDALYDCWEIHGFDSDVNDGVIDVPLNLMGADPSHKDVFLEIDYMKYNGTCASQVGCTGAHSHKPEEPPLNYIINSFSRAPVWNPDGSIGINVHIDAGPNSRMNPITGETWGTTHSRSNEIVEVKYLDTTPNGTFKPDDVIWNQYDTMFIPSRRRIFHHCLFGHYYAEEMNNDAISGKSHGEPGHLLYVTLGYYPNNGGIFRQAGTLMHELGHNFGLTHGGPKKFASPPVAEGDDNTLNQNYKPNYLSIMNYHFQFTGLIRHAQGANPFDYSRFQLLILNEDSLNEPNGIDEEGLYPNELASYGTKYFCNEDGSFTTKTVDHPNDPANGPIDWDCHIDGNGIGIDADINYHPDVHDINTPQGLTTLTSYNDWLNLEYDGGGISSLGLGTIELPNHDIHDEFAPPDYKVDIDLDIITNNLIYLLPGVGTTHSIKFVNNGLVQNTFNLTATDDLGWFDTSSLPQQIDLAVDEEFIVDIPVNVPTSAQDNEKDILRIEATAQNQTTINEATTIELRVANYCPNDSDDDFDIDGIDLAELVSNIDSMDLSEFATVFGITNCVD